MACGCGGRKSVSAAVRNGVAPAATPFMGGKFDMADVCREDNTVRVRYNGPVGKHIVSSPLRKFPSYGFHTNGDIFCVHVDDVATAPNVFVLLAPEPESDPAGVVVTPAPAAAAVTTEPASEPASVIETTETGETGETDPPAAEPPVPSSVPSSVPVAKNDVTVRRQRRKGDRYESQG